MQGLLKNLLFKSFIKKTVHRSEAMSNKEADKYGRRQMDKQTNDKRINRQIYEQAGKQRRDAIKHDKDRQYLR